MTNERKNSKKYYSNHFTGGGVVVLLIVTFFFVAIGGCDKANSEKNEQQHRPVASEVEKGPVSMLVRADRSEAKIAEPLTLLVEVRAANGVEVKFPKADKKLGPFEVLGVNDSPSVPIDDGKTRLWTRKYSLESFKSGKLKLPVITVNFTDNRTPDKPIHAQLSSKPMDLSIVSVLEGKADPAKFRDIKGVVELPAEPNFLWAWVAAGGVATAGLLAAGAALMIRAKRSRPLTAEKWALGRLDRLGSDGLIEAGQIERFYVRLSDIVRKYIERRFTIHAPKLTTREFLETVQEHSKLTAYRELLQRNLQAADMVKFARLRPSVDEDNEAMTAAREFVIASAARAEQEQKQKTSQKEQVIV